METMKHKKRFCYDQNTYLRLMEPVKHTMTVAPRTAPEHHGPNIEANHEVFPWESWVVYELRI